jgi:hypothetical protein
MITPKEARERLERETAEYAEFILPIMREGVAWRMTFMGEPGEWMLNDLEEARKPLAMYKLESNCDALCKKTGAVPLELDESDNAEIAKYLKRMRPRGSVDATLAGRNRAAALLVQELRTQWRRVAHPVG